MGTMLQASDVSLDDFDGHEGCNEILNVTRPDVVTAVHQGYLQAGANGSRAFRDALITFHPEARYFSA
jgi:methionine synthase I (cobalamin-dependent)